MSARGALVAFSLLLAAAAIVLVVKTSAESVAVLGVAGAMFASAVLIAVWTARLGGGRGL